MRSCSSNVSKIRFAVADSTAPHGQQVNRANPINSRGGSGHWRIPDNTPPISPVCPYFSKMSGPTAIPQFSKSDQRVRFRLNVFDSCHI